MVAVAVLGEGGDGGGGARRGGVVVVGLKSVTVDTVETGGGETAGPARRPAMPMPCIIDQIIQLCNYAVRNRPDYSIKPCIIDQIIQLRRA